MSRTQSYIHGVSDTSLLGDTIGANLLKTVLSYPDAPALVSVAQGYRASYREFYDDTTAVARALLQQGIVKGDRVGIWALNRCEWVLLQYATARIGAILVNINPAYRSSELEYVLNQSGIRLLVLAVSFKTSHYEEMLHEVIGQCPGLEYTVLLDRNWDAFVAAGAALDDRRLAAAESEVSFDDAVNIQYTSGTTGFPKGVTLSHHNILNNGYFIGKRLHYSEKDRVCIPVPFYHCFGMVIGNLCCTAHGACMVIPGERFDAATTLRVVAEEKCTSLYGVPTMFIAELQLPDFDQYDLSSLRTGVMAGSPCPVEIMKQVQSRMNMREITICYGMTETSPVSTQTRIGAPLEKQVTTVGTVQDHLELKVIDTASGQIVARGVKGELCTRGYSVMLHYWENPIATAAVLDDAGWMHTGDEAMMDDAGYIMITGRIKDLIIRGGENISPREIEEFLYTHEAILDVQVIGVPDEKYGEAIMAWVRLRPGIDTGAELLHAYCEGKIAHYKIPKYWKFVNDFPMTISGKVRKVEMREIAVQELGLQGK